MNREELFIKCVAPAISSNQQLASNIRSNQHANRGPRGRLAGAGAEPGAGASLAAGPRAECMHAPAGRPLVQRRRPRPPAPYGTHAPGLAIIFLYGLQGPCSAPGRARKLLVSQWWSIGDDPAYSTIARGHSSNKTPGFFWKRKHSFLPFRADDESKMLVLQFSVKV